MGTCEFQAVVLAAGRGSRMTELTSGRPKCLLPVGGTPVLCHSLKILEKAGFKDAIVLVLEAAYSQVQVSLAQYNIKLNVDLVVIPSESEEWGTADSLRLLMSQENIKSDVILLSCDLFTNTSISTLLNTYRKHKASFAALFFLPQEELTLIDPIPGLKSKYKPEKDIVGIDLDTSRLMFLASASDFEENVKISRNILKRHPRLSLRTDLTDGHLYVMSYYLAKYLAEEPSFSTLKGEFFPYVVGKQHLRPSVSNDDLLVQDKSTKRSLFDFVKESKREDDIRDLSTYTDHRGDLKSVYHDDILRCYAVLANADDFGVRINSLQSLCQANRLCFSAKYRQENETRIDPTVQMNSNQVDSDSFIGANSIIKEKTSVKVSTLGENCIVNSRTRISKSIILKKVEINEGCMVDNCVICDDSKIGRNCELKNCVIGAHYEVPDETKASFQVLTKSDGLMEI